MPSCTQQYFFAVVILNFLKGELQCEASKSKYFSRLQLLEIHWQLQIARKIANFLLPSYGVLSLQQSDRRSTQTCFTQPKSWPFFLVDIWDCSLGRFLSEGSKYSSIELRLHNSSALECTRITIIKSTGILNRFETSLTTW